MLMKRELLLSYGYIKEHLDRLFDLIDCFEIISAMKSLCDCHFSNLEQKDINRQLKEWLKGVNKYFRTYDRKPFINNSVTSTISKYHLISEECKRLENNRNLKPSEKITLNKDKQLLTLLKKDINDFSERLEAHIIPNLNTYLEVIQKAITSNQDNEIVSQKLVLIKQTLENKQSKIQEIPNLIKENMVE